MWLGEIVQAHMYCQKVREEGLFLKHPKWNRLSLDIHEVGFTRKHFSAFHYVVIVVFVFQEYLDLLREECTYH